MNKLIILIAVLFISAGCSLPTYAIKSAMTTDISKCDNIVVGVTTKVEVEKLLKEKKPTSIRRDSHDTIAMYRSGYFVAKVRYDKDNVVTNYECNKE